MKTVPSFSILDKSKSSKIFQQIHTLSESNGLIENLRTLLEYGNKNVCFMLCALNDFLQRLGKLRIVS